MATRPKFPVLAVAAWLAFVADVGGTVALLVSHAPIELKIGVAALEALGIYTIAVWYVARRHAWMTDAPERERHD